MPRLEQKHGVSIRRLARHGVARNQRVESLTLCFAAILKCVLNRLMLFTPASERILPHTEMPCNADDNAFRKSSSLIAQ
jgi:hypothetical protein